MGNSDSKEQRPRPGRLRSDSRRGSSAATSSPNSPSVLSSELQQQHALYGQSQRSGRGSQTNLNALLGLGNSSDRERDPNTTESRHESKQERNQRRLERDRAHRQKERARSMRDENVDGGYLVTQGVYTGLEDFNKNIVRQLMIERRLAPFWKGLNDHSESWTENQLISAARGLPIPAADAIPPEEETSQFLPTGSGVGDVDSNATHLSVPDASRAHSHKSEPASNVPAPLSNFASTSSAVPVHASSSGPTIFRGRSKTLASLTGSSRPSQVEMTPREMRLPKDPFVNGQPIEAYLYKDASECPICFLYYPPYLNKTRCCDQDICSECFVQIKRPDPHIPEHQDPAVQSTGAPPDPDALTSEIATCPFCKQPDFGVTYEPPTFRRGLTYIAPASTKSLGKVASAMSSSSSLASAMSGGKASSVDTARKRAQSIAANDPAVITTDRVRPDWFQKLEGARSHAARRSAAATALHTAAYLMGNRGQEPDGRGFSTFGRRALLRRGSGPASPSAGDNSAQNNVLALMSQRYGGQMQEAQRGGHRVRVEEIEDMMMAEAIRLSIAFEEDKRAREEEESRTSQKDARKEAKKKEKELKKVQKAAKKSGSYPTSASQSTVDVRGESSESGGKGKATAHPGIDLSPESPSISSQFTNANPFTTETPTEDPQLHLERARAQLQPENSPFSSTLDNHPYRPSHLRQQSNASSTDDDDSTRVSQGGGFRGSGSSFEVSPSGSGINIADPGVNQLSGTPPGGGAGLEPMFNFRSLAAMVGRDDEKTEHRNPEALEDTPIPVVELVDPQSREIPSTTPAAADAHHHSQASAPVSRSQSTRTADEAFHDAMESTAHMATPEVNITAPSRTGSDLAQGDIKVPENETTEATRAGPLVT